MIIKSPIFSYMKYSFVTIIMFVFNPSCTQTRSIALYKYMGATFEMLRVGNVFRVNYSISYFKNTILIRQVFRKQSLCKLFSKIVF